MDKAHISIDFEDAVSFRTPALVSAIHCFRSASGIISFPVCPRCAITMEREYQSYCDRCGQALDWDRFSEALVVILN